MDYCLMKNTEIPIFTSSISVFLHLFGDSHLINKVFGTGKLLYYK